MALTPACACGRHCAPVVHVGPMEWAQADAGGYTVEHRHAKQCPECGAFWRPRKETPEPCQ